jgi:hypothetical protein
LLVSLPSPIPKLQHALLPFQSVESQGACLELLTLSVVFYFRFIQSLSRSLGTRQWLILKHVSEILVHMESWVDGIGEPLPHTRRSDNP